METIWYLAFLVQYGALIAGIALVGALILTTVYELVQGKMHKDGVSGFAAVDANCEALKWRLAMVDTAEQSLDMLYYLWY